MLDAVNSGMVPSKWKACFVKPQLFYQTFHSVVVEDKTITTTTTTTTKNKQPHRRFS